jgi:hypothetical protein
VDVASLRGTQTKRDRKIVALALDDVPNLLIQFPGVDIPDEARRDGLLAAAIEHRHIAEVELKRELHELRFVSSCELGLLEGLQGAGLGVLELGVIEARP